MLSGLVKDPATRKFVIFVVGIITVVLTVRFTPLYELIDRSYLRQLFSQIAAEPWAPIVFVCSICVGLSIGFPLTPFTLVGGVVFGVWPGALYNWLGTLAGATSAFLIGRYFARAFVERAVIKRLPKLQQLDEAIARNAFKAIFSMRLIPIIPFNLSNFAAGLTGVGFLAYVLATATSLLPLVLMGTYFANALWNSDGGPETQRELLLLTALMILLSLLPWLYQRRVARSTASRAR